MLSTEGRIRKKLLLVEDEALIALAEKIALEEYGYDIVTVGSGERAIDAVTGGIDADLVLMDIDLGAGMDGTRAAARILELRDLPILFLSSHTEPGIVERTEAITSYGYVVKNSSITVLDASIKMAFKLFQANRNTQESERKQNSLIANISDVITILDRDGVSRYASSNVRRWFGWEVEEIVGSRALDNVHQDDRAASRDLLDRLVSSADGTSAAAEVRILCKDGAYKWIEINLVNMLGDPVVRGILGNYHDISDRKRVEQENQFERRFAEQLLESLPGIFYLYAYPELRLMRWNRNHEALLGFEPGEMQNRSIFEWHVPGSEEAVRTAVDAAMEKGVNKIEAQLVAKDGRLVPFLLTGVPFESDGRRYLMGIGIELGEYKRIESELQESRSRLAALFGAMAEMTVLHELVFDERGRPADYRILDCNDAFTRIMGIPREAAVGRLGSEVYGESPAPHLKEYAEVGIAGKPYQYSTYYAPMNKHFFISVVSPGRNQFATITTDITALKEAEAKLQLQVKEYEAVNEGLRSTTEELRRSHEQLARGAEELDRYFANSLDLLCIADTDGYFLRLNPEWETVLGYRTEDLEGRRFLDFVHPEDLAGTLEAVSALYSQQRILAFENRYRAKDGTYRWIEWRSQPNGRLIYASARDVTERKRTEQDLKRQIEEKEILLKEVHHRIKNNLASIEALVSLQGNAVRDTEAKEALEDTLGRIGSMRILYEKLLGGEQYATSSVRGYLESLAVSLSEALAPPPGISILSAVEDFPLPPEKLFPLGIIVNELVTNAIKYAFLGRDHGNVDIRLSKSDSIATLEIRDDGNGLPRESLPENAGGFGLTLVRMLSEQLRGEFSVESAGGTRAILKFPV
jgi:PAS domain S-box-containing protein